MEPKLYAAFELLRLAQWKRVIQVFDSDSQDRLEQSPTFYPVEKYISGLNPISEYELGFHIDNKWMKRIILIPSLRKVLSLVEDMGSLEALSGVYIETP